VIVVDDEEIYLKDVLDLYANF